MINSQSNLFLAGNQIRRTSSQSLKLRTRPRDTRTELDQPIRSNSRAVQRNRWTPSLSAKWSFVMINAVLGSPWIFLPKTKKRASRFTSFQLFPRGEVTLSLSWKLVSLPSFSFFTCEKWMSITIAYKNICTPVTKSNFMEPRTGLMSLGTAQNQPVRSSLVWVVPSSSGSRYTPQGMIYNVNPHVHWLITKPIYYV